MALAGRSRIDTGVCRTRSAVRGPGTGESADFHGGFPNSLVDVLRARVEFLGDVLLGLQVGLFHRLLQFALADDDEGGLPLVDDVPELLDVGPGHAPPQVAAHSAHRRADDGGADDRGWEQDADDGTAAPRPVPGGHLVLAYVHLADVVFGDHGGVVTADRAHCMQVLDDRIVVSGRRLTRVGADVDEYCVGLRHVVVSCYAVFSLICQDAHRRHGRASPSRGEGATVMSSSAGPGVLPPGYDQPGRPSGGPPAGRDLDRIGAVAAAGYQPGGQGVGVPHLARVEFIAAPGDRREGGNQVQQPPSPAVVGIEMLRAGDGLGDVRDHAVLPAPDLVAEESRVAQPRQAHGAFADHAAIWCAVAPGRCHLDGTACAAEVHRQRGMIQVAYLAMLPAGHDRLEDPAVPAHATGRLSRAQRQPVQVYPSWVHVVLPSGIRKARPGCLRQVPRSWPRRPDAPGRTARRTPVSRHYLGAEIRARGEEAEMATMEELLGSHPFFAGLSDSAIQLIAGCASNVHFAAGDYIFGEGETASRFYVIRHGRVALEIHSPARGPLVIDTMDEGEVLGWSWLVSPYRYFGDARAVTPVSATALDGTCLRGKCEADAELGYQLLKRVTSVMYQRLQSSRVRLLDLYGPEAVRV